MGSGRNGKVGVDLIAQFAWELFEWLEFVSRPDGPMGEWKAVSAPMAASVPLGARRRHLW